MERISYSREKMDLIQDNVKKMTGIVVKLVGRKINVYTKRIPRK